MEISFSDYKNAAENARPKEIDITEIVEMFVQQLSYCTNSGISVCFGRAEPGDENLPIAGRNFNKIFAAITEARGYCTNDQDMTTLVGFYARMLAAATGCYVSWSELSEANGFRGEKDREFYANTAGMFAVRSVNLTKKYWQTATSEQKETAKIPTDIFTGW